jgi:superfamily I DNA/RNA helicase
LQGFKTSLVMNNAASISFPILKIEGPPGSGKTRELAREACRLVGQDGYAPTELLLLAATPMGKKRLQTELALEGKLASLNTSLPKVLILDHWLLGVLKEFSPPADYPVSLLPETDARIILQEVLRQVIPVGHPLAHAAQQASASRVFLDLIRQLQLNGLSPADVLAKRQGASEEMDARLPLVAEIYQSFQERIQSGNLLCHAQLAHRVLALLEGFPQALQTLRERSLVILCDEAQEFSSVQQKLWAVLGCRLVLAGNEKLSIRSFRGAQPEGFKSLTALGPQSVTFLPKLACLRGNEPILALLNRFLPQPIWEEQALDLPRLAETVKFGYFPDPQQEAAFLADRILAFVGETRLAPSVLSESMASEDRPAQWQDCVVLLRSAHYKPHLIQAFQQRGIPYLSQVLSEETVRLQHGLYDLFTVFQAWQALGIPVEGLQDAPALQNAWAGFRGSRQERQLWTAENNRHLVRCLEMLLLSEAKAEALRDLSAFERANQDEIAWMLPYLVNPDTRPPVLGEVVADLVALYGQLLSSGSTLAVAEGVFDLLPSRWADELGLAAALAGLTGFQQNLARLSGYYEASFSKPLPLGEVLVNFQALWDGAEASPEATEPDGAVRILGLHQVQGEEFPLVLVPFLVSGEFPYTRELPEVLAPAGQAALGVSAGYQIDEAEEARLLAVGMSRATHQVILSSHAQEGTESILPSGFYTALLNSQRALLGLPLRPGICQCSTGKSAPDAGCNVNFCSASQVPAIDLEDGLVSMALSERYTGESLWAQLDKQALEPLFAMAETLNISASSIKTYMQCPRQFYYKHLLGLPQPSHEAAVLGTLIHRVMEVFNRQAGNAPYSAQSLEAIAERLFWFDEDLEAFYAAGFEDNDLLTLRKMSPLALFQLRQRLLASIADLADKGYFDRYGSLRRVYPERALEGVTLSGLERVRFRGKMDAVIELADGTCEILDYKTFRSAYGAKLDTCDKHFLETLAPLPDDEEVTHGKRFAGKMNPNYPTDYQLPLYYLACRQDAEFGDKLRAVALQIIRPAFPENPHQGSIRLEIPGTLIESKQQQLVEELNRFIISPILDSVTFEPNPSRANCSGCAYYGICELGDETSLQEDGAE